MKRIMQYTAHLLCICLVIARLSTFTSVAQLQRSAAEPLRPVYFTIQVQASTNKDQAQSITQQLISAGYTAYIDEVKDNRGKAVYQIRIGKFKTRKDADAAAREFYKKEKRSYWISAVTAEGQPAATSAPAVQQEVTDTKHSAAAQDPTEKQNDPAPEAEPPPDQNPESAGIETPLPDGTNQLQAGTPSARQQVTSPAAYTWPNKVSRIYTYRGVEGTVGVTNAKGKIPQEFRSAIESVTMFPVKFVSFDQRKKLLVVAIEDTEEKIKLAGVSMLSPAAAGSVAAFSEKTLKDKPLRLKYTPHAATHAEKTIHGFLYFRQGSSVNLEIIRQGIAACDRADIPAALHQAFTEAEASAREEKAGIWAHQ
jgi:hypothetical protein